MLRRFLARLVVIVGFSAFVAPRLSSNGSELVIHAHPAGSVDVAFSADGRQVASAGNRGRFRILGAEAGGIIGEVKIWDASSGKIRAELPGIKAAVTSVAFSPDGKLLAAGGGGNAEDGKDCTVIVWDAAGFRLRHKFRLPGPATSVAFSQDGKRLAAGVYGGETYEVARVWDIEAADELHTFRTEGSRGSYVINVSFSPDGKYLATARHAGALAGQLKVWNLSSGHLEETIAGNGGSRCIAYSPDGKFLAAGRPMANISLYAVPGGSLASTLRGHELSDFGGVWALSFSPNGSLLASAGADYTIRLWDRTQNESLEARDSAHQTLKGHTGLVRAIAFAPDGERLASASNDNTVRIWCLVDAREPSN